MAFKPDRRFKNAMKAYDYLLEQYPQSDVISPDLPHYLFRGECGKFDTTKSGIHRPETMVLKRDSHLQLSESDRDDLDKLTCDLLRRFINDRNYQLDPLQALSLLQHYGIPTCLVDFTDYLKTAFTFGVAGESTVGRVCVMPETAGMLNFKNHRWAERAQRQSAFGLKMTSEVPDLKSVAERLSLNVHWYQFPITPTDRTFFVNKHTDLLTLVDDPSAGFLRFEITQSVEARGKLSPTLVDWLLERVPIAPRRYEIVRREPEEVVVHFRASGELPFDEAAEAEHSRKYWSSAFPFENSSDRRENWTGLSPIGKVITDPRTYHP